MPIAFVILLFIDQYRPQLTPSSIASWLPTVAFGTFSSLHLPPPPPTVTLSDDAEDFAGVQPVSRCLIREPRSPRRAPSRSSTRGGLLEEGEGELPTLIWWGSARSDAACVDNLAAGASVFCVRRGSTRRSSQGECDFREGEVGVVLADELVHRAGILRSEDAARTSSCS